MQLTIFLRDRENLLLRLVAVLALPKSVSPFSEHGSLPGEFAITGDNLVQVGTIEKVIVDDLGYFGTDVQVVREAVVEAAARSVVPENAVAVAGNQKRHGDAVLSCEISTDSPR